jgi:hypothetical protein
LFFPSELNELFDGRNGLSFFLTPELEELFDDEIFLDSPSFTPFTIPGTKARAFIFNNADGEDELSLFALGEFEESVELLNDGKEFTLIALGEFEETIELLNDEDAPLPCPFDTNAHASAFNNDGKRLGTYELEELLDDEKGSSEDELGKLKELFDDEKDGQYLPGVGSNGFSYRIYTKLEELLNDEDELSVFVLGELKELLDDEKDGQYPPGVGSNGFSFCIYTKLEELLNNGKIESGPFGNPIPPLLLVALFNVDSSMSLNAPSEHTNWLIHLDSICTWQFTLFSLT